MGWGSEFPESSEVSRHVSIQNVRLAEILEGRSAALCFLVYVPVVRPAALPASLTMLGRRSSSLVFFRR